MTIDWDALTHARRALIQNPYQVDSSDLRQAETWFTTNISSTLAAVDELCGKSDGKSARKVVVAFLHALVRSGTLATHASALERNVRTHASTLACDIGGVRTLSATLDRF